MTPASLARNLFDETELTEAKLTAATETLCVTHERKQFGVSIVLEDMQAQQDLERARADYLSAIAEFNKAQYDLFKTIGGLAEIGRTGGAVTPR